MNYASLDIRFEGSKFYPSKLKEKTSLPIKVLAEYGEISNKGRYKGIPSPYGIGILEISNAGSETKIPLLIKEYTTKLLKNTNELKESGVDEIIFDIESSKSDTSEISLSPDILQNLSALNARVEFHTINDDDDLKNKIEKVRSKLPGLNKEDMYQYILKHPAIYGADVVYYIIYLFSKNYSSKQLDENIGKFEDFYNEVIKG